MDDAKDVMTVPEFARMTGFSTKTIRAWIRAGRIRAWRLAANRGRWRIPRSELQRLLGVS